MKLVPMYSLLMNAQANGYAQGAFNVTCFPQLEAVLQAHENMRSPALVQVGNIAIGYLGGAETKTMNNSTLDEKRKGAENIIKMLDSLKDKYSIPVAINADHSKDINVIKALIESGFTSVMYDGSHLPFSQNIENTREVVEFAHKYGVTVEAELGILSGVEEEAFSKNCTYTNPMDVVEFIKKTEADCLALSYGTTHGVNKGLDVVLRQEIVTASRENLLRSGLNVPLVSHGSSTVPKYIVEDINGYGGKLSGVGGIPITELKSAIEKGICKINIDTDMRLSITRNIRELLVNADPASDGASFKSIRDYMTEHPSELDFRLYMDVMKKNFLNIDEKQDTEQKLLTEGLSRGVLEIVSQLLVQFGSVGYSNRLKATSLDEMKDFYSKK